MSRIFEENWIVKKEVNMKRRTAWLIALVLVISLTACNKRNSGHTTPGNLVTPTPYSPHVSSENTDISSDYAERLSSYPWMETYDMTYYRFSDDGSFEHFQDRDLTDKIGNGHWQMKQDANGYLLLHMEVDGGESFDLYDLELYEESIFAHSLTETAYMWLLCNPKE